MNNVDISKASRSIMTLIHPLKKDIFAYTLHHHCKKRYYTYLVHVSNSILIQSAFDKIFLKSLKNEQHFSTVELKYHEN